MRDGLIKARKVQIIPFADNVIIDALPAQDLLITAKHVLIIVID
jgi:hypothetical protein